MLSRKSCLSLAVCVTIGALSPCVRAAEATATPSAKKAAVSIAEATNLVKEYYAAFSRGDVVTMMGKFAANVNYREDRQRDHTFIEKDLRDYVTRWPVRTFKPESIEVLVREDGSAAVTFNLVYTVAKEDGQKSLSGHSTNTWIVRRADGALQINSQREIVHANPTPATVRATPSHEEEEALSDDELRKQSDTQIEIPTARLGSTASTTTSTVARRKPGDFVVALDIGHTRLRGGAVSARGVFEYEFNRRLVVELFAQLQSLGFTRSFIINPQGDEISLSRRSAEANAREADLFLAIHHDSVKNKFLKIWETNGKAQKYCDDFHGYSIFFSSKNPKSTDSLAFATKLGQALLKAGFTPSLHHVAQENRPIIDKNKGVYSFDDLVVLKTAKMPAVLLECGIIVNRSEEEKLDSAAYRKMLIDAVGRAIQEFASR